MPDLVPIKRALISVADKTDLVPLAHALVERGTEIISTGGTAKALAEAGIDVTPIDKVTGFPEIMSGRVKSLHPLIHGGLLGLRDDEDHVKAMQEHGIVPIDLVCINLYPFERTISQPDVTQKEAIEQIDIGGPTLLRSAAKNFQWVTVVTSPRRYDRLVNELNANKGATSLSLRAEMAAAAFGRTSEYDAAIASYLSRRSPGAFEQVMRLGYVKVDDLRYGENPHQDAALYRDPSSTGPTIVNSEQLHGKPLSYNNINDAAAALESVKALRKFNPDKVGAAVIKHANPCGAAMAASAEKAISLAIAGDPVAAFGGILAVNRIVDANAAHEITGADRFFEVVVAPEYEPHALEIIKARWQNVRVLAAGDRAGSTARKLEYRSVPGGMLVQEQDTRSSTPEQWVHAAGPEATPEVLAAGAFLETVARYLSSNSIAIGGSNAGGTRLFGAGAGQMDRVSACRLAINKAGDLAKGAVAYSDGFFPFPDGPKLLLDAGVKTLIHPGGSKRDQETFDLCDERGVTCLVTSVRRFKH